MICMYAVLQTPGVFRFEGGVRSAVGVIDQMSSVLVCSQMKPSTLRVFSSVSYCTFFFVSVFLM